MTPEEVRPLLRSERDDAAAMLTLAFDADPLFRWFLPEAEARAAWLRWFHRRALHETLASGGAFTVGPTAGAVLVHPPGAWPLSFFGGLAAWPVPPGVPPWRLVRWGLWIERAMQRVHPVEPHLYLYVLGVHPSQKGKGLGGALLRHVCALADSAGVPCHLETSNPDNLGLYRHFGYEIQSEITAHGGSPLWTLTRAARAS